MDDADEEENMEYKYGGGGKNTNLKSLFHAIFGETDRNMEENMEANMEGHSVEIMGLIAVAIEPEQRVSVFPPNRKVFTPSKPCRRTARPP